MVTKLQAKSPNSVRFETMDVKIEPFIANS